MSVRTDKEILFTDGAWEIKGVPGYEGMFDQVYHKCAWKKNWIGAHKYLGIHAMLNTERCRHCGVEIPTSIMGVWKLKNFDLIQSWGAGPSFYGTVPHSKPVPHSGSNTMRPPPK